MINNVGLVDANYKQNYNIRKSNPFASNQYDTHYLDSNKKVSFGEGVKLFAKGFGNQVKDMVKGIVQHPIKTATTIGLTTGALLALPLVGIPTAVGGAVMAVGFATIGTIKMIGNTASGIKHNRNGNGELARDCFEKAGSAGVDVALSAPFVPKGLKAIKDFVKFGKFGINASLLSELKSAKGLKGKIKLLKDANTELARNYDYQKLVEQKLEELNVPKDKIGHYKKELLEFNVPVDDIPKVVAKKVIKSKGYDVEVPISRKPTEKGQSGYFSERYGEVTLKDHTKPDLVFRGKKGKRITKTQLTSDGQHYIATIKDAETGELSSDIISRKIYDDYMSLYRDMSSVSDRGQEVLTVVHELEHWWQRGQINRLSGQIPKNVTPQARVMYERMLHQQPQHLTMAEGAQAARYHVANANYCPPSLNPVKYLENALEVDARAAEAKVFNSPEFKVFDSVLKDIKEPSPFNLSRTVLPPMIQVYNQTA